MTVQELIDELMKVEDKSKKVAFYSLKDEGEIAIVDAVEHADCLLLYDY